jgi:hypothetical protein
VSALAFREGTNTLFSGSLAQGPQVVGLTCCENVLVFEFNHNMTELTLTKAKKLIWCCTGSFDRTVKVWNLNEMAYVESLFGHQVSSQHGLWFSFCFATAIDVPSWHAERGDVPGLLAQGPRCVLFVRPNFTHVGPEEIPTFKTLAVLTKWKYCRIRIKI